MTVPAQRWLLQSRCSTPLGSEYVTKADKLGYSLQEAQDDAQKGTVKVFIAPEELERSQTAGEFELFFRLIIMKSQTPAHGLPCSRRFKQCCQ